MCPWLHVPSLGFWDRVLKLAGHEMMLPWIVYTFWSVAIWILNTRSEQEKDKGQTVVARYFQASWTKQTYRKKKVYSFPPMLPIFCPKAPSLAVYKDIVIQYNSWCRKHMPNSCKVQIPWLSASFQLCFPRALGQVWPNLCFNAYIKSLLAVPTIYFFFFGATGNYQVHILQLQLFQSSCLVHTRSAAMCRYNLHMKPVNFKSTCFSYSREQFIIHICGLQGFSPRYTKT